MTLELRDNAPAPQIKKLQYIKVSNPDNPKEFAYVEKNLYDHLAREAGDGMSGFFDSLWSGVKGAVGGFVTGGPVGAIAGAIGGFVKPAAAPKVAVSTNANAGTATIAVSQPVGQAAPAIIQPTWYTQEKPKDNTLLYVGLAAVGAMLLTRRGR